MNGSCIPGTNLCSQYCSNGCDINQSCSGGCQDGWTGQKCTETCADQCRKCNQNGGKNCEICKGDYYTATCTLPCSLHCSALPGLSKCNINNGTCLNGCDKGYWDVKCDKKCYEGCTSGSCNLSDGFCDTCNRTHYGNSCQDRCSEQCVDNDASSAVCYKSNGTCVHGCKDRYRGKTCEDELTVSTIVSSSTEKIDGRYDESDEHDSFAKVYLLGMLTGVGVCLLSLVAFVAVRHIRQRRKQPNGSKIVREERPYVNTAVTMQAVSSTVTECNTKSVGSNQTSDETPRSVYDSLDGDKRDDRHLYSGLERQTDHHSTGYANS
ncbi:multiple epidermal growth factor-like domains protein 10 [Mercenaria mercenaria]|uniref:multiple epidermal growth factor-like domains protein 10 n=1 Tax=Mercenaria mercenaria TaxID=6596 RepID=UPI00234F730F|nr:multiple epidermal growth factor-like domains protein 10 [Mercenaria mercenaria]